MGKNNKRNVSYVVDNAMCTGCGICEDVCPRECIHIVRINGEFRPEVDENLCLDSKCGRCLKVCPGQGINLLEFTNDLFVNESMKEDKYLGRYVGLHTGYSINHDIRYHSASGGLVSQFLIYLLDKKIIDGAVVTGFDDDHITPRSYIARNREDIIAARSSKYCPVSLNKVGNEIVESEGKYVIVGLPCHIQGFRKRLKIDKRLRERVVGLFSIYCSSNRTFYAQDYLFKHYGIKKNEISYFSYRDHGCLGNLTIKTNGNSSLLLGDTNSADCGDLRIPFIKYYVPVLRSFFKPHRCLSCIDHYGLLADICFGDIHIQPYSEDHIGVSSWITRTEYWEKLFHQAVEEGYIMMEDVDAEILNKSQFTMLYSKQRKANVVMRIDQLWGRTVPKYGVPLDKPGIKDYISVIICHAQRYLGKRQSLWFWIDLLHRK